MLRKERIKNPYHTVRRRHRLSIMRAFELTRERWMSRPWYRKLSERTHPVPVAHTDVSWAASRGKEADLI